MINGRGCKQKSFWLVLAAFNGRFVFVLGHFTSWKFALKFITQFYMTVCQLTLNQMRSLLLPVSLSLSLARSLYPSLASLRRNVGNILAKSLRHHLVIVKQSPGQLQEKCVPLFLGAQSLFSLLFLH